VDLLNALVALAGVCVTIVIAWASTRSTRARRRAEEAQLATQLLNSRREAESPSSADPAIDERLEHTARFATAEFTRLMLDAGPRWWSIIPVGAYGAALIVAGMFAPNPESAAVYSVVAAICAVYTGVALWIKRRRTRRLRDAGVPVPTIRELFRAERQEWIDVFEARRQRRHTGRQAQAIAAPSAPEPTAPAT
jgi:Flp pilus assembly protein TadB